MNLKTALMVVSLVISVIIGIVLARGGTDSAGGGKGSQAPLIGLSLDTEKEARWQADRDLFKKRCMELGARDVRVLSAQGDDTKQVSDVQSLITAGCDVIVIVAHNGEAMAEGVRRAHAAGIPVIAYDRLIMNCDLDLYLSFDNVNVGRLQAQWLIDHLPGKKGKIVRIMGSPTDNNAKLFKQGQDEVLKPYLERGDIQIIHEDWAEDWRPDNARKIVDAAITRFGKDFQAVLATNDSTAAGAHQVLVENQLAGKVLLTGQDADLIACQRIVAGTQSMTIYKPLARLANQAAELAMKMAQGKPVIATQTVNNNKVDVPAVLGEIVAVDQSNIDETVIKDGYHTREAVYGAAK